MPRPSLSGFEVDVTEEEAMALSQELLAAADEDARARVVVHWLPAFARCQVKTAARVKSLCAEVKALGAKMDEYHGPKAEEEEQPKDPRLERLRLILGFAARNWPAGLLILIFLQAFGLIDILERLIGVLK